MKISVVMPCHDCGPWIEEALESVAAQTLPALEIIVVNDQSSDDSVERIASSGVPAKLLHTRFGNAAAARNAGLMAAKGDWVAFLDADDTWDPEHLLQAQTALMPGDVAFFALHRRLVANGRIEEDPRKSIPLDGTFAGNLSPDLLCDTLVFPTSGWPTSGMVVQRKRLLDVGGFDESLIRRHDAELLFRVVHGHSWAFSKRPTWRYRIRDEGSLSSNSLECAQYFLMALRKIETLYPHPSVHARLRRQSRIAIGAAVRSGDRTMIDSAFDQGGAYSPPIWRYSRPLWTTFPKTGSVLRWLRD